MFVRLCFSEMEISQSLAAGSPHLAWDHPFYDIARHQIIEVAGQSANGDASSARGLCLYLYFINTFQKCFSLSRTQSHVIIPHAQEQNVSEPFPFKSFLTLSFSCRLPSLPTCRVA